MQTQQELRREQIERLHAEIMNDGDEQLQLETEVLSDVLQRMLTGIAWMSRERDTPPDALRKVWERVTTRVEMTPEHLFSFAWVIPILDANEPETAQLVRDILQHPLTNEEVTLKLMNVTCYSETLKDAYPQGALSAAERAALRLMASLHLTEEEAGHLVRGLKDVPESCVETFVVLAEENEDLRNYERNAEDVFDEVLATTLALTQ